MSLLVRINRYCRRNGVRPSRFGRLAVQDPRLVQDLLRGRQLGTAIAAKIEAFLAAEPRA